MLTTQMALNLLALNDFDGARTEIKKTHEREAVIADLRDKEYLKREDEAQREGVTTQMKDLRGYPVETLDAPEVVGLKTATRVRSAITWLALSTKPSAKKTWRHPAIARPLNCAPTRHYWKRPCWTWTNPRSAPMKPTC